MKTNLCDTLLRRSVENQFLTYRHNQREDEMLEEKFSLYQRQIRLTARNIHTTERRFEQHAKNDLGLLVSRKQQPLEASQHHRFYYSSTNKQWTSNEYHVEPMHHVVEHRNLSESAFEHRSQQYREDLKRKARSYTARKQDFLDGTESFVREDHERPNNDWPLSEHARIAFPAIHRARSNRRSKRPFSMEM